MRILHTADLHLGRQFNGIPLEEDHAAVLEQILSAVVAHDVDVLIIAGDIFDRAAPPASAVRQFNSFLSDLSAKSWACVVLIAGNHDSGDRIEAMSVLIDRNRALIRGALSTDETPLILQDEFGPVAFTGLPFAYEHAARECFQDEDIHSPEDVLTAQIESAKSNLPQGMRWVVTAHAFVAGSILGESERSLTRVGGIETVSPSIFEGAHYVALGHIHRPQTAGAPHIRYSGAPLAFGFDETHCPKSVCLVDLDAQGKTEISQLPLRPRRGVRTLRGLHREILQADPSEDFIRVVLTDKMPVIDGMKRIREVFPNACELTYERNTPGTGNHSTGPTNPKITDPIEIIRGFIEQVRGEPLSQEEHKTLLRGVDEVQGKERLG